MTPEQIAELREAAEYVARLGGSYSAGQAASIAEHAATIIALLDGYDVLKADASWERLAREVGQGLKDSEKEVERLTAELDARREAKWAEFEDLEAALRKSEAERERLGEIAAEAELISASHRTVVELLEAAEEALRKSEAALESTGEDLDHADSRARANYDRAAELQEALEPFAALASLIEHDDRPDDRVWYRHSRGAILLGDLRRARATLTNTMQLPEAFTAAPIGMSQSMQVGVAFGTRAGDALPALDAIAAERRTLINAAVLETERREATEARLANAEAALADAKAEMVRLRLNLADVVHTKRNTSARSLEFRRLLLEPSCAMLDAALSVTASWLNIEGSAITVNREKMRRRVARLVEHVDAAMRDFKPDAALTSAPPVSHPCDDHAQVGELPMEIESNPLMEAFMETIERMARSARLARENQGVDEATPAPDGEA